MQLLLWKKGPTMDQTGSFRSKHAQDSFATFSQNKAHRSIHDPPIQVVGGGYLIIFFACFEISTSKVRFLSNDIHIFKIGIYIPQT